MREAKPGLVINKWEYLVWGLAFGLGFFIIFGSYILNGESLYLGVVQEQYYLLGQRAFDYLIREELREGYFPLWNPDNGLGHPLLGNMVCGFFYPLKIMVYLFPVWASYELYIIFRFLIGGFFAYLVGRRLGLSIGGSLFVVLGFSFSGYFQVFLNENYLNADFLVPLLIFLGLKIFEQGTRKWLLASGLCLFGFFNSGHPEAIFYNWVFLLVFFLAGLSLVSKEGKVRALAGFILANLVGLFLSLGMILAFLENWGQSYHFHLPNAGLYHYSIKEFLAFFSPWFFGGSEPGSAFFHPSEIGRRFLGIFPGYEESTVPWLVPGVGMIYLPLLVLGLIEARRLSRIYLFLFIWVIIFLGLIFGLAGFQFLGWVPPFSLSGNFKHSLPSMVFSLSLIGGLMLDRIFEGRINRQRLLACILISLFVILIFFPYRQIGLGLNLMSILEMAGVGAFLLWLVFALGMSRVKAMGYGLALILVLVSGLARVSWQERVYLDYDLPALRQNSLFKQICDEKGVRFYFDKAMFAPNLNLLLGVAELRTMDGIYPRRLVEVVNFINGHTREDGLRYYYPELGYLEVMPEKLEHPLLKLLGVKYIITKSPLPYSQAMDRSLREGFIRAPSREHIGIAYFEEGGARLRTLYQHPPSLIRLGEAFSQDEGLKFFLRFFPRIQAPAIAKEPDGVWFITMSNGGLKYARYLHPREKPEERNLGRVKLALKSAEDLKLITLPEKSPDFDWSGWVDLRIGEEEAFSLEMLGWEQFWFYLNPNAVPGFFWVKKDEIKDLAGSLFFDEEFLDGLMQNLQAGIARSQEELRLKNFSTQKYIFKTNAEKDSWLFLSQVWYPGWRARIDGVNMDLKRMNFLPALAIPAGSREVEIFYAPWSFRIGIFFALSSFIALLGFLIRIKPNKLN